MHLQRRVVLLVRFKGGYVPRRPYALGKRDRIQSNERTNIRDPIAGAYVRHEVPPHLWFVDFGNTPKWRRHAHLIRSIDHALKTIPTQQAYDFVVPRPQAVPQPPCVAQPGTMPQSHAKLLDPMHVLFAAKPAGTRLQALLRAGHRGRSRILLAPNVGDSLYKMIGDPRPNPFPLGGPHSLAAQPFPIVFSYFGGVATPCRRERSGLVVTEVSRIDPSRPLQEGLANGRMCMVNRNAPGPRGVDELLGEIIRQRSVFKTDKGPVLSEGRNMPVLEPVSAEGSAIIRGGTGPRPEQSPELIPILRRPKKFHTGVKNELVPEAYSVTKPGADGEVGRHTDNEIPNPPDAPAEVVHHGNRGIFTLRRARASWLAIMGHAGKTVARITIRVVQKFVRREFSKSLPEDRCAPHTLRAWFIREPSTWAPERQELGNHFAAPKEQTVAFFRRKGGVELNPRIAPLQRRGRQETNANHGCSVAVCTVSFQRYGGSADSLAARTQPYGSRFPISAQSLVRFPG